MVKKSAHKVGPFRHKASWKAVQTRSKTNQRTKLALIMLGFLLLCLSFGQLIKFTDTFFNSFTPEIGSKNYTWDSSSNINLVIKGKNVSALFFNPEQKTINIVNIPDQTYIDVPGGYGSWQIRSIYDLGQAERQGNKLISQSISSYLGMPIDGFLELKGDLKDQKIEEVIESYKNPISFFSLSHKINTDLTPLEVFRLILGFGGVRFDKIKTHDLEKLGLLESEQLADGTQVLVGDSTKIDAFVQNFIEDKINSERLTVAILNATEAPGLAEKVSRVISNMGGNVIQETNFTPKQQFSKVIADEDLLDSYTYKRLFSIFNTETSKSGCQDSQKCDSINVETRAQINIILGEDFRARFK